jgi:folate-dependent phosphoribosylglycinamide formyltransferase PurN
MSRTATAEGTPREATPHDIAILGGETPWTWALAHALRARFGAVPLILEDKEPTLFFLRRRMRRLGVVTVAGQVGLGLAARALRPLLRRQERAVLERLGLDPTPSDDGIVRVASANAPETIEALNRIGARIVVVSQTRILAPALLRQVATTFINVHTGITPRYRGMHGAYWALARGDPANCGVTVHLVDAGIDTGPIIAQARIQPSPADSYFTYHWPQLAAALPLLIQAIEDARAGRLTTIPPETERSARLFYHPTLWGYVGTGLRCGVW